MSTGEHVGGDAPPTTDQCVCGKPDSPGTHGPTICDSSPDTVAYLQRQSAALSEDQQTYFLRMSGRCANGSERDAGQLVHAIRSAGFPGWRPAVCGAAPGRKGNGWSESDANLFTAATCRRCLRRLSDEAPSFSPNFDERNGIR